MENKTKRFYKVGETVWVVAEKKEGKVKSINKDTRKVVVTVKKCKIIEELEVNLWDIDKLKYRAKEDLIAKKRRQTDTEKITELLSLVNDIFYPEVFFAKVREGAIIPSKRKEDAGYDIYAELTDEKYKSAEGHLEIFCPALTTTLVPTGLATAMPSTHFLNLKHERGSTGVQSMNVLAGVIDSGFRNEMFIALTPLKKDVIITNAVLKVEENDTHILYPYTKAICQGTVDLVPEVKITEITYEELKAIESERGMTMLGQSGK
ncbi:MAG: hypothetical protein ABS939_06865 [Psychrobacillus sp.]